MENNPSPLEFIEVIQRNTYQHCYMTFGNVDNSGEPVRYFKGLMKDDLFCIEKKTVN